MRENSKLPAKKAHRNLLEDEEGAVFVEYLTLVITVGLVGAAAFFFMGVPLVRLYEWTVTWIVLPIP